MARKEMNFDAVRMMRSIRDRISKEMSGMTFEEQQAYICERLRDEHRAGIQSSRAFPSEAAGASLKRSSRKTT